MSAIIVTWERSGSRVYDVRVVLDSKGEAKVFESVSDAGYWQDENDSEVGAYTNIIDINPPISF